MVKRDFKLIKRDSDINSQEGTARFSLTHKKRQKKNLELKSTFIFNFPIFSHELNLSLNIGVSFSYTRLAFEPFGELEEEFCSFRIIVQQSSSYLVFG